MRHSAATRAWFGRAHCSTAHAARSHTPTQLVCEDLALWPHASGRRADAHTGAAAGRGTATLYGCSSHSAARRRVFERHVRGAAGGVHAAAAVHFGHNLLMLGGARARHCARVAPPQATVQRHIEGARGPATTLLSARSSSMRFVTGSHGCGPAPRGRSRQGPASTRRGTGAGRARGPTADAVGCRGGSRRL